MKTEDIKKILRRKRKIRKLTSKDFLSTGSTLLNLACTSYPYRGFAKGLFYFFVGDSKSGKTWFSLTCLAEAAMNNNFKKYRFIYDNGEDGALMDIERFFGKGVADRMEAPAQEYSSTIEEFYYNVDDAHKESKPFIYILDSMDSLTSDSEGKKFDEHKKAYRECKDSKGSMGDGKAKVNSTTLRRVIGRPLEKNGSILIIINQTRDNFGASIFEPKQTRSGGRALTFYACFEMWSSVAGQIEKTINGKKRQLGVNCRVKVKKNRVTGRDRTVTIPIYHSVGIDDVGSCVDYLLDEGYWTKKKKENIIDAKGLGIKGSKQKIIKLIQQDDLEKDLHELVADVWNDIEEQCTIKRKRRYE